MTRKEKAGQTCTGNTHTKVKKLPYKKSIAVKQLEQLANDAARQRYPNTPAEYLAPRIYRDNTANSLTRCIIDFLTLSGCQAERISNTGRMIDTRCTFSDVTGRTRTIGQTKWIKGTGKNGTADISATIKGRSIKIEIKYGKDRQSEAQRLYQSQVQHSGGLYFIATSFEQFLNWYNQKFGSDEN
jgi:hypothetical protein